MRTNASIPSIRMRQVQLRIWSEVAIVAAAVMVISVPGSGALSLGSYDDGITCLLDPDALPSCCLLTIEPLAELRSSVLSSVPDLRPIIPVGSGSQGVLADLVDCPPTAADGSRFPADIPADVGILA